MTRVGSSHAYRFVKRPLDVMAASVALVVLSPVIAVTAVLVRSRLGSPVLFTQPRPGLDGRTFRLVKFRSMLEPDAERGLITDADRLTSFGARLRSLSLDELPSLINVLRGDMSIVGPRPLLVTYLDRYDEIQARRHEVRPGITGLAQASGRNAISWEEKLRLDVEYVDSVSLLLDARILARTVIEVVARRGVSADGEATVSEFRGSTGRV